MDKKYENDFNAAFQHAIEAKRLFLADAVEKEAALLHGRIDQKNAPYDDSFMVPSMDKVGEEVRRIHPRLAHFKCIGWDFAVDDQGDPVLIEFNVFPGIVCSQLTCCRPIFGDQTDWILEDYFLHRKLEQKHRLDMLIR